MECKKTKKIAVNLKRFVSCSENTKNSVQPKFDDGNIWFRFVTIACTYFQISKFFVVFSIKIQFENFETWLCFNKEWKRFLIFNIVLKNKNSNQVSGTENKTFIWK